MMYRMIKGAVLAIAILAGGSVFAASLNGVVTDAETAAPIAGVHVILGDNPQNAQMAETNEAGEYLFEDIEAGEYPFHAGHPGYEMFSLNTPLTIDEGENTFSFDMTPHPGPDPATLAGFVTADDMPVAGAVVMVGGQHHEGPQTETAADGSYFIEDLMAGPVMLNVMAEGYEPFHGRVDLAAGDNTFDVDLQAENNQEDPATLAGFVTADDMPVAGAVVMLGGQHHEGPQTETAEDGSYFFEDLMAGPVMLNVMAEGYERFHGEVELQAGENTFDVVLQTGNNEEDPAALAGIVFIAEDPDHPTFIAGALVTLQQGENDALVMTTGEDGQFLFENLLAGDALLEVEAEGFELYTHIVHLHPGENFFPVHLNGDPGNDEPATLSGMVLAGDMPVAGATLFLVLHQQDGVETVSGEDGTYYFGELTAGRAMLNVMAEGYEPFQGHVDLAAGDNTFDVNLLADNNEGDPATLAGFVTADDLPVAGAVITLFQDEDPPVTTTSGEDGSFLFAELTAGPAHLIVEAGDFPPFDQQLNLQPGENFIEIVLGDHEYEDLTVCGRVVDFFTREPVAGALVELRVPETDLIWNMITNEDGRFAFQNLDLSIELFLLRAEREGYQEFMTEVGNNGHHHIAVPVLLMPLGGEEQMGTITGLVTFDETGDPAPMSVIEAFPVDNLHGPAFTAMSNPEGGYVLNVPEGEYIVSCFIRTDNDDSHHHWEYRELYDDAHNLDEATPVQVDAQEETSGIDFGLPLPDGGTYTVNMNGYVRTQNGQPLAGALVRFWDENGEIGDGVYTDDEGHWDAALIRDRLPIVPFSVSAEAETYEMEFFSDAQSFNMATQFAFTSDAYIGNMNFTMDAENAGVSSIAGRILNTDGDVLSDGLVAAFDLMGDFMTTVSTNAAGEYTIQGLDDQEYALMYFAPGYAPRFSGDVNSLNDAVMVDAGMQPDDMDGVLTRIPDEAGSCMVNGIVTDNNGDPVYGALVLVQNQSTLATRYSLTDQNGEYLVAGLEDETEYTMYTSLAGYLSDTEVFVTNTANGYTTILYTELEIRTTEAVQSDLPVPARLILEPNYPNPFNPTTTIQYGLNATTHVNLSVYNLNGQRIATLVNDIREPGWYQITFDASELASGIYISTLVGNGAVQHQKMVLIK